MTNYLAADLRQVLADLDGDPNGCHLLPATLERLERIIERVEKVDADPVDADVEPEGCSRSPLEPDQEIRSDALDYAVQLATAGGYGALAADVLDLADTLAGWIRTGERPA